MDLWLFACIELALLFLAIGEFRLARDLRRIERRLGLGVAVKTVVVFGTPNKT